MTMMPENSENLKTAENLTSVSLSSEPPAEPNGKNVKVTKPRERIPAQIDLMQKSPRVSPAEFSRLMGVSRNAVFQWQKTGKITVYADGTIDAAQAAKELLKQPNSRMKARIFKTITNDADVLRAEIEKLNERIKTLESDIAHITTDRDEWKESWNEVMNDISDFLKMIVEQSELKQAVNDGNIEILAGEFDDYMFRDRTPAPKATTPPTAPQDDELFDAEFEKMIAESDALFKLNFEHEPPATTGD